jgi:hypothetical protein
MTALKNQGKTLKRYLNKTPEKRGITPVIYPLHPTNRGLTCGICNSPSQAGPKLCKILPNNLPSRTKANHKQVFPKA